MKGDYMKCSLCEWKTKRFFITPKGKKVSGIRRLTFHFETAHHDEYAKIVKQLEFEFPEEGDNADTRTV